MAELLSAQEEVELAERIAAGRVAQAALAAGPDPADRPDLEAVAAAGTAARDRFIAANLRLANRMAGRYRRLLGDDAVQEAVVGVIKAVDRFDPAKGYRFSTYAAWWIRQALTDAAARSADIVRTPHPARRATPDAWRTVALPTAAGVPVSVRSVADAAGLAEETVAAVLRPRTARFEDHDPERRPFTETLAAVDTDPAGDACRLVASSELRRAVAMLPAEQRRVVVAAFGLDGSEPLSLSELSRRWGIRRATLAATRNEALSTLRGSLSGDTLGGLTADAGSTIA